MNLKPFIHDDFLLSTRAARRLYHEFAAPEPIFDYHCHLSPSDIAENWQFRNLFEIWLEGDHYKWRAMRSNGVPERFCTGDATPLEKFKACAATVPQTLRNPLYHWAHLEQGGNIPGKVQLGSGWWFLDQKEAMEWQLNALSNLGLLSGFVGMVTDSRSFMSCPRHEYFRRVLCNLIGRASRAVKFLTTTRWSGHW